MDEPIRGFNARDKALFDCLLREVNDLGYPFTSNMDFLTTTKEDHSIIPVLIRYIGRFDNDGISADLVRGLTVPGFYEATPFLLDEFKKLKGSQYIIYRWQIATALSTIFDKKYIDEYIRLINDKQYSRDCGPLIRTLGKRKHPEGKPLCHKLLSEGDHSNGEVYSCIVALGYYKDIESLPYLEPYLQHKEIEIRKIARRVIDRISQSKQQDIR